MSVWFPVKVKARFYPFCFPYIFPIHWCSLVVAGNPKDGGILPRSLDVVFNSILDRYSNDLSLKPRMFGDVVRLTPSQVEREQNVKDKVFKMACTDVSGVCNLSMQTIFQFWVWNY